MNQTLPPSLLIQTWVNIATAKQYPVAREKACERLHMFFDDVSQAVLYLEMKKTKISNELVINDAS